jgi:DNA/RNA-binding domain of Phe-tRNA-synthetase-like protein
MVKGRRKTMQVNVTISDDLKKNAPNLKLGIVTADVQVTEHNENLWNKINAFVSEFNMEMAEIAKMPPIDEARKAYRALGKDPTRYRLSSDSLMRRIVKSKGLYQVNDIVDLNNLLSLECGHSIGTYDLDKLTGNIVYGIGRAEEAYVGIGRGPLNIEGLHVLRDEEGSFGSATSDSERTMVTLNTKKILMNIIAYDGDKNLSVWMEKAEALLRDYVNADQIESWIVE